MSNAAIMPGKPGRDTLVREWTENSAKGFDIYIRTKNLTDHLVGPGFIRVRVDPAFVDMLQRRRLFCGAEGLHESVEKRHPDTWDGLPNSRVVDFWRFHVNKKEFWFKGFTDGVASTESASIYVIQLENFVTGTPQEFEEDDLFFCHGGCVFYSDDDPDDLLEKVLAQHPEVAARQIEIDMAARLSKGTVASVDMVGRRRLSL